VTCRLQDGCSGQLSYLGAAAGWYGATERAAARPSASDAGPRRLACPTDETGVARAGTDGLMRSPEFPTWMVVLVAIVPAVAYAVRRRRGSRRADELAEGAVVTACGRVQAHPVGTIVHLQGEVDGPPVRTPMSDVEAVWAELREYRGSQLSAPRDTPVVGRAPDGLTLTDGSGGVWVWMLHADTRWIAITRRRDRKLGFSIHQRVERSLARGATLTVRGEVLADGTVLAHRCATPVSR
jgi:hypothetical protein